MKKERFFGSAENFIDEAGAEVIDIAEGSLIDNFLLVTKDSYILLLETFQTVWSSIYTMITSEDIEELLPVWNTRKEGIEG